MINLRVRGWHWSGGPSCKWWEQAFDTQGKRDWLMMRLLESRLVQPWVLSSWFGDVCTCGQKPPWPDSCERRLTVGSVDNANDFEVLPSSASDESFPNDPSTKMSQRFSLPSCTQDTGCSEGCRWFQLSNLFQSEVRRSCFPGILKKLHLEIPSEKSNCTFAFQWFSSLSSYRTLCKLIHYWYVSRFI